MVELRDVTEYTASKMGLDHVKYSMTGVFLPPLRLLPQRHQKYLLLTPHLAQVLNHRMRQQMTHLLRCPSHPRFHLGTGHCCFLHKFHQVYCFRRKPRQLPLL